MRKFNIIALTLSLLTLNACMGAGTGYNISAWPNIEQTSAQLPPSALGSNLPTPYDPSSSSTQDQTQALPAQTPSEQAATLAFDLPPAKVALLLPLSGTHASLGKAMLQAAQMATFDIGHTTFNLIPIDTKGTTQGAKIAASEAVKEGAQLVLGPVFANSVRAAKPITERARIQMLSFSTDWSLAGGNTFIMGFLPFDQVERIVSYYSAHNNLGRIGVIAPQSPYGNTVTQLYRRLEDRYGLETVSIEQYAPQTPNLAPLVRNFTDFDKRTAAAEEIAHATMLENMNAKAIKKAQSKGISLNDIELADIDEDEIAKAKLELGAPFDAVLMPVGGQAAITISNLMSQYDLPPRMTKRLGTGLFDDLSLASEVSMRGAWFAAPSPRSRQNFESRYKSIYGKAPPRLSSLAYDATALTAVLAQRGLQSHGTPSFDRTSITNPNGFSGIDGIFRFHENGIAERGLAILEYQRGKIVEIDPAPKTFQNIY